MSADYSMRCYVANGGLKCWGVNDQNRLGGGFTGVYSSTGITSIPEASLCHAGERVQDFKTRVIMIGPGVIKNKNSIWCVSDETHFLIGK